MIKKILNNYFSELLKSKISRIIKIRFFADIKFVEKNGIVKCYVKKKYSDAYYKCFKIYVKEDSLCELIYIFNHEELLINDVEKTIEEC